MLHRILFFFIGLCAFTLSALYLANPSSTSPTSASPTSTSPTSTSPTSSASEWRKEYFYEHAIIRDKDFIPASEALVQLDWKYISWPDFQVEQLFELTTDPDEKDLIKEPGQQTRLAEMRTRFQSLKQAAK